MTTLPFWFFPFSFSPFVHLSFPLPSVPRLFILRIIHPSSLPSFSTDFRDVYISFNSFFSSCLDLHSHTHFSISAAARSLAGKTTGKESSLNAPFTKPYEISMWL